MSKEKKEILFVIFIFILAFVLRLGYLFFLRHHYFFYDHPSSDVTYYQQWAHTIATGDFIKSKDFFGLPLYPHFLAVIKRLSLGNLFVMRLFHLLLGSLNCVLLYYLTKKIFSIRVAGLAAILMAGNFLMIYYDWLMMPVTLLITLSLIIVFSFLHFELITKKKDWIILGLLLGLGILGDGKLLLFFVLLIGTLMFRWKKPLLFKIKTVILPLCIGVFIILLAVTFRNKAVWGDWIFISPQSGLSLYAGNNPDASGVFENPEFIRPTHGGQDEDQRVIAEAAMKKTLTPKEVSQFWRHKAVSFIFNEPFAYLNLLKKKFLVFFTDTERAHDIDLILQRTWHRQFNFNPFFILCPLALLGMFLARRVSKNTRYLNIMILSQFIMTMIFFLTTRHRSTILPYFIIYESFFICWAVEQIHTRKFKQPLIAAGFIIVFLVLFRPESVDSKTLNFLHYAKSGPVYEKHKQYKKAQQQYIKALKLRPGDSNSYYNLGNAYLYDENLPEAQKSYLKAVEICHYNVDALFNLGYTYEQTDTPDLALQSYQQVLQYQPDSLDAHFRIANIYQREGDCQKAKIHYAIIKMNQPLLSDEINARISQCQ